MFSPPAKTMPSKKRPGTVIELDRVPKSKTEELKHRGIKTSKLWTTQNVLRTDPNRDDPESGLKDLITVDAAVDGIRPIEYVTTKRGSPWEIFRRVYQLKLDSFITVAARNALPCELVMVKQFTGAGAAEKVVMMKSVLHENFLPVLECFQSHGCFDVLFNYVPTSLDQIVTSPHYPTELQLAAILGQILKGIAYLESRMLHHGSMSCSSVLIDSCGLIQITGQEGCGKFDLSKQAKNNDIRDVGYIAVELMQKYPKEDGAIGVDDLNRWPIDSDAVGFLSMVTSATSAEELLKHPLLKRPWHREDLIWMVAISQISVARRFKFLL